MVRAVVRIALHSVNDQLRSVHRRSVGIVALFHFGYALGIHAGQFVAQVQRGFDPVPELGQRHPRERHVCGLRLPRIRDLLKLRGNIAISL